MPKEKIKVKGLNKKSEDKSKEKRRCLISKKDIRTKKRIIKVMEDRSKRFRAGIDKRVEERLKKAKKAGYNPQKERENFLNVMRKKM